jgi:hypothetical protein
MSDCEFITNTNTLQRNGDTRKFKVGEPVCVKRRDGSVVEGTYQGRALGPGNKVYQHFIGNIPGSFSFGTPRALSALEIGKKRWPTSKTAMTKVFKEKLGEQGFGDESFIKTISQSGYGKRKSRKSHHRKNRKTRKHKRA